jgi:hypothetical protein
VLFIVIINLKYYFAYFIVFYLKQVAIFSQYHRIYHSNFKILKQQ